MSIKRHKWSREEARAAVRARWGKSLKARTAARVEAERRKAMRRAKHNWDRADKRAAKGGAA